MPCNGISAKDLDSGGQLFSMRYTAHVNDNMDVVRCYLGSHVSIALPARYVHPIMHLRPDLSAVALDIPLETIECRQTHPLPRAERRHERHNLSKRMAFEVFQGRNWQRSARALCKHWCGDAKNSTTKRSIRRVNMI